jgi:hypothetical protein
MIKKEKKMNKLLLSFAIIATTTLSNTASAYDQGAWALGLGASEVFGEKYTGAVANVEYRSADSFGQDLIGIENLSWIAGAEFDTNSSAYGYAGLLYDIALTEKWSLTPSLAAGFYTKGDGKDLGGAFEFRENIELNYKLTEASRLGLAISHKSNAGIYDRNPGTETIQAVYSVELN